MISDPSSNSDKDRRRDWHRAFGIALVDVFAGAPWRHSRQAKNSQCYRYANKTGPLTISMGSGLTAPALDAIFPQIISSNL
jgi:hypothetical protein